MRRLLVLMMAIALAEGCATPGVGAGPRVGTDVHFPPQQSGGATSGLTSDQTISQPNSAATSFQTLELANAWISNTAGAETADLIATVPYLGLQVPLHLGLLNAGGRQNATTSGATPTVAWSPRKDLLVVAIGANATSLTVTQTDLETDYEIEVAASPILGATGNVSLLLNGTASGYEGRYVYNSSTTGTTAFGGTMSTFLLCDTTDASTTISFRAMIRKVTGGVTVFDSTASTKSGNARYIESMTAVSTFTTNATSLVVSGALNAGSVVTFRRVRGVAN